MSKVSDHIENGKMWQNADGKWCKKCPSCGKQIIGKDGSVTTKFNMSHSIIIEQVCHSCIKVGKPTWSSLHKEEMSLRHTGKNHPFYGKHHTDEMKKKQSDRYKGRILDKETRRRLKISSTNAWKNPEIREKYFSAMTKTKWIKVRTDKGQLELLEKWNRLGFNFQSNYQIKIGPDLFYIDGYDPIHNVIVEYDSSYHNKPSQFQKDTLRQKKIKRFLNPKRFWRYNAKSHIFIECMDNKIHNFNRG